MTASTFTPAPMVLDIPTRYDAILDVAKAGNPGCRRHMRQSPTHKFVKRLSERGDAVLRFVTDLRVLFDNR